VLTFDDDGNIEPIEEDEDRIAAKKTVESLIKINQKEYFSGKRFTRRGVAHTTTIFIAAPFVVKQLLPHILGGIRYFGGFFGKSTVLPLLLPVKIAIEALNLVTPAITSVLAYSVIRTIYNHYFYPKTKTICSRDIIEEDKTIPEFVHKFEIIQRDLGEEIDMRADLGAAGEMKHSNALWAKVTTKRNIPVPYDLTFESKWWASTAYISPVLLQAKGIVETYTPAVVIKYVPELWPILAKRITKTVATVSDIVHHKVKDIIQTNLESESTQEEVAIKQIPLELLVQCLRPSTLRGDVDREVLKERINHMLTSNSSVNINRYKLLEDNGVYNTLVDMITILNVEAAASRNPAAVHLN